VRSGQWIGATGKPLTNVLSIGIGGSCKQNLIGFSLLTFLISSTSIADLGPEFVFEALRTDPAASKEAQGRSLKFLANVDPVDVARALSGLDPETTLGMHGDECFMVPSTCEHARIGLCE
jgi:glucose-6-phosphate isomerase